jgi:hypothetical protein
MRHLLFITVLSLVITPIVALQEELSGQSESHSSMQYQMLHSLDRMSEEAAQLLHKLDNRISSGIRDLLD